MSSVSTHFGTGMSVDEYIENKKNQKTDESSKPAFDLSGTRTPKTELGKDDFLNLLVAQLANQDPLDTKSDTEFIAQMAQFSALEQMQALNETFAVSQAQNMIGKNVIFSAKVEKDGIMVNQVMRGMVSGTININGKMFLQVGNYNIDPSSITALYDDSFYENNILNSSTLVNKYITAIIPGKNEGDESVKVNGQVERIEVKEGIIYAIVGDKEVQVSYITAVSDTEIPEKPPANENKPDEGGDTGNNNTGEGGNEDQTKTV